MAKTTISMIDYDVKVASRGLVVWATCCYECGSPTTKRKKALFVAECPVCNLPGCDLCMPKGSGVPCNECVKLMKEDPEYG